MNSEITPFETTNNLFVSFEIESNNSALNEQLTVRKVSLEADLLKWRSAPDRNDRPVRRIDRRLILASSEFRNFEAVRQRVSKLTSERNVRFLKPRWTF